MKIELLADLAYSLSNEDTVHPYLLGGHDGRWFALASGEGTVWVLDAAPAPKELGRKDLSSKGHHRFSDESKVDISHSTWLVDSLVATVDRRWLPNRRRARVWRIE